MPLSRGSADPIRTLAEVVLAVHDGTQQVSILNDELLSFLRCTSDVCVLELHLSSRNRTVIRQFDRGTFPSREVTHELGHHDRVEVLPKLIRKSRLARGLGSGQDYADH